MQRDRSTMSYIASLLHVNHFSQPQVWIPNTTWSRRDSQLCKLLAVVSFLVQLRVYNRIKYLMPRTYTLNINTSTLMWVNDIQLTVDRWLIRRVASFASFVLSFSNLCLGSNQLKEMVCVTAQFISVIIHNYRKWSLWNGKHLNAMKTKKKEKTIWRYCVYFMRRRQPSRVSVWETGRGEYK